MSFFKNAFFGRKKKQEVYIECVSCHHVHKGLKKVFTCPNCGTVDKPITKCRLCGTYIKYGVSCHKCLDKIAPLVDSLQLLSIINTLLDVGSVSVSLLNDTREDKGKFKKYIYNYFVRTQNLKLMVLKNAGLWNKNFNMPLKEI